MKPGMSRRLRSAVMVAVLAVVTLPLSSSPALAQAPVPAGTPVAISSLYIGPDLGGSENIGSAISAAINVGTLPLAVDEVELGAQSPVGLGDDLVGVDDPPISIPENTPTTMSSVSTEPWVEDTTTTETGASGTVVSTTNSRAGSSGGSAPRPTSGVVATAVGATGLPLTTTGADGTNSSVTTTTTAAESSTASPTAVAAISSLPLPQIVNVEESSSSGLDLGVWIVVALAAVLAIGLGAAAITRRLRAN